MVEQDGFKLSENNPIALLYKLKSLGVNRRMMSQNLSQTITLDGVWDFGYCKNLDEKNPPIIPVEEQFEAKITVPGCWDDQIENLKSATFWPDVSFNPDYKPINFPIQLEFLPDSSLPFIVGVG